MQKTNKKIIINAKKTLLKLLFFYIKIKYNLIRGVI